MNGFRQSGVSLISMLVGMLIALLSIAALLSLYQLEVNTSVNAMGVARRDGQLDSAWLTAGQLLQQAGYGIEDATDSSAPISGDGKQIVWYFRADLVTDSCAALGLGSDSGGAGTGLYFLPDCTTDTREWLIAPKAAAFVPQNRTGQLLTDEVGAFSLSEAIFTTGTCTLPYVQGSDVSAHRQISLVIPATPDQVLFSVCLANIGT